MVVLIENGSGKMKGNGIGVDRKLLIIPLIFGRSKEVIREDAVVICFV